MSFDTIMTLLNEISILNENASKPDGPNPLLHNINPFMVTFLTLRILHQIKDLHQRLDSRCLKLQDDMIEILLG